MQAGSPSLDLLSDLTIYLSDVWMIAQEEKFSFESHMSGGGLCSWRFVRHEHAQDKDQIEQAMEIAGGYGQDQIIGCSSGRYGRHIL